ncbi:hypothetical protein PPACK8108_LOCUS7464, partial [Phakopsora pachyrhizi]
MSTWPDAKTGAGLEVEAIGDESQQIARWVVRSRVTKVVRVVRLEGGLGGGSAEFVNGELDPARRLPRVKTRVARVITLGLPHVGPLLREVEEGVVEKVGDRQALKYGEPREKLFQEVGEKSDDCLWGAMRDWEIDGSAGSGPMANATAAVVEDDCGSAVASVSAAAAATVVVVAVDDGKHLLRVFSSAIREGVRFVKGGDHPRGWIWDGVGVSVFAQSRVSDRLIEGDNVVDEGEIVDMEWVRGVGWVWGDDGMSSVTRVSYHMLRHPSEAPLACHIPGSTLDELSDSPVIKSQHRIVFEKIKEHYKQCYETDPDEEEPSPIELFLELKKVYNEPPTQEQLQENDLIENTQNENLQLTNPQQRVTEEYEANFQLIAKKNSGHIPHGGLSITPNESPADFDGILRNEESLRQQVIIGPFITQEDQNHTSSTSNQQSVASINPQHLLISHSSTPTNHRSNTNNSTEERQLSYLLLNSEVIDFDLLKELQYTSMENRAFGTFIKEISAEIKFNKSDTRVVNLFKNINTKSNRAFGIAFEEISTVVGQYSHSFKSEVDEEGNTISIGSG